MYCESVASSHSKVWKIAVLTEPDPKVHTPEPYQVSIDDSRADSRGLHLRLQAQLVLAVDAPARPDRIASSESAIREIVEAQVFQGETLGI